MLLCAVKCILLSSLLNKRHYHDGLSLEKRLTFFYYYVLLRISEEASYTATINIEKKKEKAAAQHQEQPVGHCATNTSISFLLA